MSRIYLSPPHVGPLEREMLLDAFDSNWIAPLGPHVDAFESEMCAHIGVHHGAALSSGTAGLGGTRDIIPSTGRGTGGVTAQAGAADSGVAAQGGSDGGGQDSVCDMAALQFALQDAAIPSGLGMCIMDTDPSLSSTLGQPWGVIIIDGDGRLVVATGPAQKLVYTLADQRWTCVAGSTFLYWCSIAA